MVRPARGDEGPEPRAVAEDAEMGELVDDDRLERFGRGEDEPPAEHQPAVARRASPPAPWIAQRDRRRRHAEGTGVVRDRRVDRDPGIRLEPRLEDAADPLAVARGEGNSELEAIGTDGAGDG